MSQLQFPLSPWTSSGAPSLGFWPPRVCRVFPRWVGPSSSSLLEVIGVPNTWSRTAWALCGGSLRCHPRTAFAPALCRLPPRGARVRSGTRGITAPGGLVGTVHLGGQTVRRGPSSAAGARSLPRTSRATRRRNRAPLRLSFTRGSSRCPSDHWGISPPAAPSNRAATPPLAEVSCAWPGRGVVLVDSDHSWASAWTGPPRCIWGTAPGQWRRICMRRGRSRPHKLPPSCLFWWSSAECETLVGP